MVLLGHASYAFVLPNKPSNHCCITVVWTGVCALDMGANRDDAPLSVKVTFIECKQMCASSPHEPSFFTAASCMMLVSIMDTS